MTSSTLWIYLGMVIVKCQNQSKKKYGKSIEEYLKVRKEISLIVFLIDIRHDPSSNDKLMYDYIINTGFPCIIIANKADKIAVTKVDNAVQKLQNSLNPLKDLKFLPFSAERRIYSDAVWEEIEKHIQ